MIALSIVNFNEELTWLVYQYLACWLHGGLVVGIDLLQECSDSELYDSRLNVNVVLTALS